MPRLYSPVEKPDVSWRAVNFENGVGVVPLGTDVTAWTADGYQADNSKHELTLLDKLTPNQLRQACDYLGIAFDQVPEHPDSKQTLVRAIETSLSTKYLGAVVIASAAGTEVGDTKITITGAGTYKYKTAQTTAPAPLYMDDVSDWADIATGDELTPAENHDKITVAKVDVKGHVLATGTANIAVK